MRVKIAYTVELDSIPTRVLEIMKPTLGPASELSDMILEAMEKIRNKDSAGAVEDIMAARELLLVLEQGLSDSVGIMTGYHKAKLQEDDEPAPPGGPVE